MDHSKASAHESGELLNKTILLPVLITFFFSCFNTYNRKIYLMTEKYNCTVHLELLYITSEL
jgi:hypothetical protein